MKMVFSLKDERLIKSLQSQTKAYENIVKLYRLL